MQDKKMEMEVPSIEEQLEQASERARNARALGSPMDVIEADAELRFLESIEEE